MVSEEGSVYTSIMDVMAFIKEHDGEIDSRISFSLVWFEDEEVAEELGRHIRRLGWTYNGGISHGYPLGRETNWDRPEGAEKRYAVTF